MPVSCEDLTHPAPADAFDEPIGADSVADIDADTSVGFMCAARDDAVVCIQQRDQFVAQIGSIG